MKLHLWDIHLQHIQEFEVVHSLEVVVVGYFSSLVVAVDDMEPMVVVRKLIGQAAMVALLEPAV